MDWTRLEHAYGNASDVPALLAGLLSDPHPDVLEELWSRLCHQGSVYSASFAALPLLVDAAEKWKPIARSPLIALVASILATRHAPGACPDDLLPPVEALVPRFQRLCHETLAATKLPARDFLFVLQAARSLEGDRFWGENLDHLADGEFPGICPSCGVDLFLVIGEYGFFTTAEEWIQRGTWEPGKAWEPGPIRARPGIHSTPIDPNEGELPEVGRWLHERAQAAQQDEVADWIRHVFGKSACPSCGHCFEVQDAIADLR